jgi:hypothetical protein
MSPADRLSYGLMFVGCAIGYFVGGLWAALFVLCVGLFLIISAHTRRVYLTLAPLLAFVLAYGYWAFIRPHYILQGTIDLQRTLRVPIPPDDALSRPPVIPPGQIFLPPSCAEEKSRPYKCNSIADLARRLTDENAKIENSANDTMNKIQDLRRNTQLPEGMRNQEINADVAGFSDNMRECCMDDMEKLREEAIFRLGPSGKDSEEERQWKVLLWEESSNGIILPGTVRDYAPYLHTMGEQLQNLSSK